MQEILGILANTPGLADSKLKELTSVVNSKRGEEPGLQEAKRLLGDSTVRGARNDRRVFERAFIFHERRPELLADIRDRYRSAGHHGMATRMETGAAGATRLGFSKVAVIRRLPIALVSFGFTREFPDHRARLTPLQAPDRDRAARRPLVTIESNTEGVFFELNPQLLWRWCHMNRWTTDPEPDSEVAAREWLLRHTYARDQSSVSLAVQRLTHAWAHTLIHALEGRSAFGPNSVAEYLMERTASFFIYVANYSTFNLGGLTTLVEQRLADWLDAAVEQTTCVHDPVCINERGGCHKCLALAFHCERFNRGLHRGYLVGSEDPYVDVGWILHAASADH